MKYIYKINGTKAELINKTESYDILITAETYPAREYHENTHAVLSYNNPVILNGEIIIVDTANGETRTKTGDGTKTYTQLPFDDEAVYSALNNKCDASVAITATLLASAWSSGQQTITVSGLGATQNGIASLPQNCSDSEYEAVCAAGLMVTSQSAGSLTFSANGEVPQIDIPILIILLG